MKSPMSMSLMDRMRLFALLLGETIYIYIYIYMPAGSRAGWEIIVFFTFVGLRLVGQEVQK